MNYFEFIAGATACLTKAVVFVPPTYSVSEKVCHEIYQFQGQKRALSGTQGLSLTIRDSWQVCLTVVSSLLSTHSPHSYFHVIFTSAYPAVQVKLYAYVDMLDRNDLITN